MLLTDALRRYLNARQAEGWSHHTLDGAKYGLQGLVTFLATLDIEQVEQMDGEALQRYREHLSWKRTKRGQPLQARSQSELLSQVRSFCKWLLAQDWVIADPSAKLANPRRSRRQLPKAVMKQDEVQRLCDQPDLQTPTGFRDRTILEVMYSSGIRRQEVVNLQIGDVDLEAGVLMVREGKFSKDRVVPIGKQAGTWLRSYLAGIRPDWPKAKRTRALFLNRFGDPMHPMAIWQIVNKAKRKAGLEKAVSPHAIRHSCATHMVQAGAPLRHIQELLGHNSIETTQIYTQLTITDLKEAHGRFHPREQQPLE